MKIEKIILKNFSAISNAMNTNELEIDFSNMKNKICLIIGDNGRGKTTLLSLLNPFAGVGNLDVRDGLNLILEDKDGYKEIHIRNNDDYYIIKHFYTAHKDKNHSVKSYISKNDNELNVNGNVTSFKELVKIELGIETDYLKLIRIGSNVTSMIDLSETERKNFMSKLLDEIGVFLTYYKKVNNDLHQLKEMISHNVDKLNKLGIDNKAEVKSTIKKLEDQLEVLQTMYGDINGRISVLRHDIDSIDEPLTLKDRLSVSSRKLDKMNKILEKQDDLESTDVEYYANLINECEKNIAVCETQISSSEMLIQNHLTTLNQLREQLRTVEIQYRKESDTNKEIIRLHEEQDKVIDSISKSEINLGTFSPEYSKSEYESFIVFIKNTQMKLDKTYEFGKEIVSKIIELLENNSNVPQFINSHIMNLDDSEDTNMLFLRTISTKFNFKDEHVFDNCTNSECEAKQLWKQVANLLETNEVNKKKVKDISYYKDMEYAYQNIRDVLLSFSGYKSIIEKLPTDIRDKFSTTNLYKSIKKTGLIYDEKKLNNHLSLVTEYNDYLNLLLRRDELEREIKMFSNTSNLEYIKEQIETISYQIDDNDSKVKSLKHNILDLKENLTEYKNNLEVYYELKETFEKHDELVKEVEKLQSQYDLYVTNSKQISDAEGELYRVKVDIDNTNKDIQRLKSNLDQYKAIQKELDNFNEKFDEMTVVKEALSSKKGMSLYYIKSYLGNTEEITNELLDIAYDGQIYIDNFKITPTEFTIPFFNRGKLIRDVKYASQGEISFLSIALSFGLASQTLTKYNIMLLDEIDGPLDTHNRAKFIKILENQIERIGSEQSFLITHNDMFSSYPVDIIDLNFGESDTEKYELANFIPIKRK
jgi:DNA repair exonuclease SbcCD ATPase subunit